MYSRSTLKMGSRICGITTSSSWLSRIPDVNIARKCAQRAARRACLQNKILGSSEERHLVQRLGYILTRLELSRISATSRKDVFQSEEDISEVCYVAYISRSDELRGFAHSTLYQNTSVMVRRNRCASRCLMHAVLMGLPPHSTTITSG